MNCSQCDEMLDRWIDGELSPEVREQVELHLRACDACGMAAEHRRREEAQTRQEFDWLHAGGSRVAATVLDSARVRQSARPGTRSEYHSSWTAAIPLALAAAAGFLIATILFQPWKQPAVVTVEAPPSEEASQLEPQLEPATDQAVARVMVAMGAVEMRATSEADWQTIPTGKLPAFQCPGSSEIRTGKDSQCELMTSSGGIVRMDRESEVVVSNAQEVALRKGQLWTRSSADGRLTVKSLPENTVARPSAADVRAVCPPSTSLLARKHAGGIRFTSAEGPVEVITPEGPVNLRPGQFAEVTDGRVEPPQATDSLLLDTSWMQPLLLQKGGNDPELQQRLDAMLASFGRSKLAYLYEREIRSLGSAGVLPLMRFIQSPLSTDNAAGRETAMRVIGDMAPASAIPDLIDLLSHPQATVREHAARALLRLTGEDFGRSPEAWRQPPDSGGDVLPQAWSAWWSENRFRYAPADSR